VNAPVFISYSSIDQKVAETICDAVQARGHRCWISTRDIGPGENFQEAIVKAIGSAKLMILVFTSNANNLQEIKKELALAGQHQLVVIPVRVENVVPSGAFAYELATRQWIDLFNDWERNIAQLTAKIGTILSEGGAPTAVPEPLVAKTPPAKKHLVPVLFSTLLIAALGGSAALYFRAGASTSSPLQATSSPAPSAVAPQQPPNGGTAQQFDGNWLTTMDCPQIPNALGFTWEFVTRVAGDHLHAQRGGVGAPASLTFDGDIAPDGSVTIDAKGFSGSSAFNPTSAAPGQPYAFLMPVRFESKRAKISLHLPAGRPCDLTFVRQERCAFSVRGAVGGSI
jgi:TIR domain